MLMSFPLFSRKNYEKRLRSLFGRFMPHDFSVVLFIEPVLIQALKAFFFYLYLAKGSIPRLPDYFRRQVMCAQREAKYFIGLKFPRIYFSQKSNGFHLHLIDSGNTQKQIKRVKQCCPNKFSLN